MLLLVSSTIEATTSATTKATTKATTTTKATATTKATTTAKTAILSYIEVEQDTIRQASVHNEKEALWDVEGNEESKV
jgi:hypothetical protein